MQPICSPWPQTRTRCTFAPARTQSATTCTLVVEGWATAQEKSRRSLSARLNQWVALRVNGVIDIFFLNNDKNEKDNHYSAHCSDDFCRICCTKSQVSEWLFPQEWHLCDWTLQNQVRQDEPQQLLNSREQESLYEHQGGKGQRLFAPCLQLWSRPEHHDRSQRRAVLCQPKGQQNIRSQKTITPTIVTTLQKILFVIIKMFICIMILTLNQE